MIKSFILVVVLAACGSALADRSSICSSRHVKLNKASELHAIANKLQTEGPHDCSPDQVIAISKLDIAIQAHLSEENKCGPEVVEWLNSFFAEYIASKAPSHGALPKPFKAFYLAFGFQLSRLCEEHMNSVLSTELSNPADYLSGDDLVKFNEWSNQSPSLDGQVDQQDLAKSIIEIIDKITEKRFVFVITPAHTEYRNMQATCQGVFKPIYGQTVLPLLRMQNLGFRGFEQSSTSVAHRHHATVEKWQQLTWFCELLLGARFYQIHEPTASSKAFSILGEEDGRKFESLMGTIYNVEDLVESSSSVDVKPKGSLDDEILPENDKQLSKLIRRFNTNLDSFRLMMKKLYRFYKNIKKASDSNPANREMVNLNAALDRMSKQDSPPESLESLHFDDEVSTGPARTEISHKPESVPRKILRYVLFPFKAVGYTLLYITCFVCARCCRPFFNKPHST